ncbi:phage tail assembly protein [Pseudomonas sp. 3A(2025)]
MSNLKPLPKYLTLTDDGVIITLSKPIELNSVAQDRITMRAPTVRDVRLANKTAEDDEEQREVNLFASLTGVGVNDFDAMAVKDYTRLQAGYFRLVRE